MPKKLQPESPILKLSSSDGMPVYISRTGIFRSSRLWLCADRLADFFNEYGNRKLPERIQIVAYDDPGSDRYQIRTSDGHNVVFVDGEHTSVFMAFRCFVEEQINVGRKFFGLWELGQ